MRAVLLALTLALVAYLVAAARFDPDLPFLFASGRLTWWCAAEPLATLSAEGPYRLTFHFTPARPGWLEVAAMSRFRLLDGERVLAETGDRSWKRVARVKVPSRPLRLEVEDRRRLPTIGIGGEAAPDTGVGLERGLAGEDAVRARELFAVLPSLPDRPLAVAVAMLAVFLAAAARLAWRTPRPLPTRAPPSAPAVIVVAILMVHAVLAAWNVAHYPIDRGLDAAAHVAYARTILDEHRVPDPDQGFQTYHPPLYHLLGAGLWAVIGSDRALQILSALCGMALLVLLARYLPGGQHRGLLLLAFAPVLLIAEPQATNEVLLALLTTAALGSASGRLTLPRAALAGGLAGLALLTKYTGLFALVAVLVAIASREPGGPRWPRRATATALALAVALAVGGAPYLSRWSRYGDPFVGNWDDILGHPYRQPPGFRIATYFLRFGVSLVAHPFRAREGSLWDALYVSLVGDGFGRFLSTPAQHVNLFLLAWAALPLLLATLWGFAATAYDPARASRGERAGLVMTLLSLAAMVRYNLELPYWSAAKGVFLLMLALPVAAAFERGRDAATARGGIAVAAFLDAALAVFVAISILTFTYRI